MVRVSSKSQEEPDWEGIILQLTAYTDFLFKNHHWYRGNGTSTSVMGKSIEDYVNQALKEYLYNPHKFDPQKGSLINYLKYYLVRQFISNDSKSSENTLYLKYVTTNEEGMSEIDLDQFESDKEYEIDDSIDTDSILNEIEESIKDDRVASQIFTALGCGFKKSETCEDLNISGNDYDKGIRRLRYQADKIKEKYNNN